MAIAGDDQVIVDDDAERPGDVDDRSRHVDIGARRGRIAGGMIVEIPTHTVILLNCRIETADMQA